VLTLCGNCASFHSVTVMKRTRTLAIALLLALAGAVMVPGPAQAATAAAIDTNVWYSITAKNSGLRVDVRGAAKVNGTPIQQYTANTSAAQKFRFISNGDGTYRISSALTSSQVLDVAGGATGNGAKVQTWSWANVGQQRWFVYVSAVSGYVTIKPAHATSRCLDVPGGSTRSGVQLQIYSCNNTAAQQFKLTKVGAVIASTAVPSFRLPFANGASVSAGAPHANDGTANGVRNSVDFGAGAGDKAVRAIAGGTVYKVACASGYYLGVDHGGGWKSTYYHLTNVQTALVGKTVSAGTYLGNVGRAVQCGGSATFDHVHLSLFKNGTPYPLNGVRFGNYVVYAGSGGYFGYWNKTSGVRALTIEGAALCCLTAG
jgi:murein DD-endopeptidase MepM/ murein hydrolase activator NlpD